MSGVRRQAGWAAGAGALAVVLFAPERALATLVLLLILACPVLMVFMLRGTPGGGRLELEDDATGTTSPDERREAGTLRYER